LITFLTDAGNLEIMNQPELFWTAFQQKVKHSMNIRKISKKENQKTPPFSTASRNNTACFCNTIC